LRTFYVAERYERVTAPARFVRGGRVGGGCDDSPAL